jgi:sigma-B regulation protein RsbU (phosphoserine phosphatase)
MALGAVDDTSWERKTIRLEPQDVLIVYTDGFTDAQDSEGRFYSRERFHKFLKTSVTRQVAHRNVALTIQETLLAEMRQFMGDSLPYDDMTLMVLVREPQ